jgi:hypothetical protein
LVDLVEIVLPSLDVLLRLHEEDLLLLVVVLDRLGQSVLPVLKHLNQQL